MDKIIKNILPSKKGMLSTDEDIFLNLDLKSDKKELLNNNVLKVLDIAEQFNIERQNSKTYRITLKINSVTPFNSIKKDTETISDLLDYKTDFDNPNDFIDFIDIFNAYVCKPKIFYKEINNEYLLGLEKITKIDKTDIIQCGYDTNIYGDQSYQILFEEDIRLENDLILDSNNDFRLPITELYVFFEHKNINRTQSTIQYLTNDGIITNQTTDLIYGGKYLIDFETFFIEKIGDPQSEITLSLNDITLKYLFSPVISITIREYSTDFEVGNIKETENIPEYAYLLSDETNSFNKTRSEGTLVIPPIFSGSTRLLIDDPINLPPRKLIFNTKTKFHEFYLDNDVLDDTYLTIFLNNNLLENGVDYLLSSTKNKIILRFTPKLNDQLIFNYSVGENYIWKDILDIGFIDPETNIGVDYPFVNGKHYIHETTVLVVKPNFDDITTKNFYCKFVFTQDQQNVLINPNSLPQNC